MLSKVKGVLVPMVTPFSMDGSLDEAGTCRIIDYFNEHPSIDGLFIMGATGEYVALTVEERKRIIDIAISIPPQKLFIVNVGTQQEQSTYELAEYALGKGIKTIGVVIPAFYDFSHVKQYFAKLDSYGMSIFVYQTGDTKYQLSVGELVEIASLRHIVGIKDSCCSANMLRHLMYLIRLRDKLSIIVGAEGIYLSSAVMGASGVIGGGCNIDPFILKKVQRCISENNISEAAQYQDMVFKYITEFSSEDTCNQSIKYYLNLRGVRCGILSRTDSAKLSQVHMKKIEGLTAELIQLEKKLI